MKKRFIYLVGCFLLFVAPCGCGSDESNGSGCASDKDCKGDRICENQVCVMPPEHDGLTNSVDGGIVSEENTILEEAVSASEGGKIDTAGTETDSTNEASAVDGAIPVDTGDAGAMGANSGDAASLSQFEECPAGLECFIPPAIAGIDTGFGFCVEPGMMLPRSCQSDADCVDFNTPCTKMDAMGISMSYCLSSCGQLNTSSDSVEVDTDGTKGLGASCNVSEFYATVEGAKGTCQNKDDDCPGFMPKGQGDCEDNLICCECNLSCSDSGSSVSVEYSCGVGEVSSSVEREFDDTGNIIDSMVVFVWGDGTRVICPQMIRNGQPVPGYGCSASDGHSCDF